MTGGRYLNCLLAAAALLIVLTAVGAYGLWIIDFTLVAWTMIVAGVPLAAIVWLAIRHETAFDAQTQKRALLIILIAAGVMRLILIPAPTLSSDIFRYIWDGRVQAAGINPYEFFPARPELSFLRDQAIFSQINRVDFAPTIYPPVAQMIFFIVTRFSESVWAMKLAMVGFDLIAMAIILALLKRRRLPSSRVLVYAWHPLIIFEFAGSGHVDAIAIAFMLAACLAAYRRSDTGSGILLAAGTLAKFFPLVIAPALYRRWDWRAVVAGAVTLVAGYALYLSVGWKVLGYLPGYAEEESLTVGEGFFVLGLLGRLVQLPSWASIAYLGAGALILFGLAIGAVMRRNKDEPSFEWALVLIGAFTLILSPHLPWYFTWLLPFLCFVPSPAGLILTIVAPMIYGEAGVTDMFWRSTIVYAPFLIVLVAEIAIRARGKGAKARLQRR